MNKRWLAAAAITLLVAVPVALKIFGGKEGKEVEVERAAERVITPSILASGTLVYQNQVSLVSEVIGRVDELLVKEGDEVAKGQVLLRLDGEGSRAEIAQLAATRRQAELNVERQRVNRDAAAAKMRRYEVLREKGLIEATKYDEFLQAQNVAEVELKTSREAVTQAEAQLQQSRQRLAKTEIRSPIDGKVTSVTIKRGETAVPSAVSIAGSNLMVIADTRHMFAEINVDEADIGRIAIGQEAKVVPAAYPDRSLRGKVEQVALTPRQATAGQSRAYPVKIRLESGDIAFHPGMSCRAEIATGKAGGTKNLGVPLQAVQYEDAGKAGKSRTSVFVLVDGRTVKREVDTGVADDGHIEILKGLKKGEAVIVGPAKTLRFLRDGEAAVAKALPPAGPASGANPL